MVESGDYWRGYSDALTLVGVAVAMKIGDTPPDQASITITDLGQIVLQVRARADAKPIPGVDPE